MNEDKHVENNPHNTPPWVDTRRTLLLEGKDKTFKQEEQ